MATGCEVGSVVCFVRDGSITGRSVTIARVPVRRLGELRWRWKQNMVCGAHEPCVCDV